MNQTLLYIFLILVILSIIIWYNSKKEHFEDLKADCPMLATINPGGKIVVQPGNKSFDTMNAYLNYLNDLYANGSKCIPPKIENAAQSESTHTVLDFNPTEERAYSNMPINKLSDYEGDSKSDFMNKLTLDWANLPFQSGTRPKQEMEFVSKRLDDGFRDPETGVFFKTVEGSNIVPPDKDLAAKKEKKILSSYRPTDITKHTVDDETSSVAKLVNRMYIDDPNWEPVVTKIGDHQWEIAEIRPKAMKEMYDDQKTTAAALSDTHMKPTLSIDDHNRLDPYFDKTGISDKDNNKHWKYDDFRKWTPGLERMFAPTLSTKEWE